MQVILPLVSRFNGYWVLSRLAVNSLVFPWCFLTTAWAQYWHSNSFLITTAWAQNSFHITTAWARNSFLITTACGAQISFLITTAWATAKKTGFQFVTKTLSTVVALATAAWGTHCFVELVTAMFAVRPILDLIMLRLLSAEALLSTMTFRYVDWRQHGRLHNTSGYI